MATKNPHPGPEKRRNPQEGRGAGTRDRGPVAQEDGISRDDLTSGADPDQPGLNDKDGKERKRDR